MHYEPYTCNCNNYEYLFERKKICESRCNEPDNISQNCCEAKCVLLEDFISNDGNFNKTAMALFYGKVGDPQTVQNIGECEAMSKNL